MPDPIAPGAGQAPPAPAQPAPVTPAAPPAGQVFNELVSKKGFKSPDDVAKSYGELESTHTKKSEVWKKNRELLESEGVAFDEDGNIVIQQGQGQPPPIYPGGPAPAPAYIPPQVQYDQYGNPLQQADPFQQVNNDFFQNPATTAMRLFNQMYGIMEQTQIKASQVSENFF